MIVFNFNNNFHTTIEKYKHNFIFRQILTQKKTSIFFEMFIQHTKFPKEPMHDHINREDALQLTSALQIFNKHNSKFLHTSIDFNDYLHSKKNHPHHHEKNTKNTSIIDAGCRRSASYQPSQRPPPSDRRRHSAARPAKGCWGGGTRPSCRRCCSWRRLQPQVTRAPRPHTHVCMCVCLVVVCVEEGHVIEVVHVDLWSFWRELWPVWMSCDGNFGLNDSFVDCIIDEFEWFFFDSCLFYSYV